MFAQWIRDQDEEGDSVMGIGLPGRAETKKFQPAAALDDDDVPMKPQQQQSIENKRRAAAALARLRSTEQHAAQQQQQQTESKRRPQLKGTTKPAPENAVPAVLFVVDASAPTTEGKQMPVVEELLGDQPLNACVISRGSGELHVVGFNTNLACRTCKEPRPLTRRVVVRNGVGVHRALQQVCSVCGLSLDKWALVDSQLHTDAKAQAERIRAGMQVCFGVPSKAAADDALAWKAALGCLQDLSCAVDSGPDSKQRVQKVVVFFTQSATASDVLLTMPSLHTDGQLELVPVIVVYTGSASTAASRLHSATVPVARVDVIRERIAAATRRCNTLWQMEPSADEARWFSFAPFAPVLLPPNCGLIAFAEGKEALPQYETCQSQALIGALNAAYQRDPTLDDEEDPVDYAIFDKLKIGFQIAQAAAADGSSEAGRSKETDAEGATRGAKKRRI